MIEFFNHHSNLTREGAMARQDTGYISLSDLLTENAARRIVLLLLANSKAREIVLKMQHNGMRDSQEIVKKFIACNWDRLDNIPDITDSNTLNFEYVDCGFKGANHRCPFSTTGDPKPYCVIKNHFNIPNYAHRSGNKYIH